MMKVWRPDDSSSEFSMSNGNGKWSPSCKITEMFYCITAAIDGDKQVTLIRLNARLPAQRASGKLHFNRRNVREMNVNASAEAQEAKNICIQWQRRKPEWCKRQLGGRQRHAQEIRDRQLAIDEAFKYPSPYENEDQDSKNQTSVK
ncbi:uncharacterized protein LOC116616264 isoform X2 [Nematostella vectensis]|uniref:uncharacterized protein LOC116616264 isoform X2 n=1 Tax=Nematostella vectensis TaxID=45351 RepID=UPI00207733B0|nr:uncharacterized protein LOC116616264 isoform X2 [Nematostella vectensis]